MAQVPKPTDVSTSKTNRSVSETRATPSRAVFSDLSDAHASITGRRTSNWPPLSPGWAKDQPVVPNNPKSTPLESVARVSPPSVRTSAGVAYGHVVATRGGDHVELISPTINRSLRNRPVPPVGPPEIPDSEVGEIGSKFPGLSRPGSSVDAATLQRWNIQETNTQVDNSKRRSRSLGHMPEVANLSTRDGTDSLPQNNTMSDVYQSYACGTTGNAEHTPELWSRPASEMSDPYEHAAGNLGSDEYEGLPPNQGNLRLANNDHERVSPIQTSIARVRGPELPQNDSYESFQAWIGGAQSEAGSEEIISATQNSIARVALFNQDGFVGSRPLSGAEMVGFEDHVNRQLERPSNVSLVSNQTNAVMDIHGDIFHPAGRISLELTPQAVHDGPIGSGTSVASTSTTYSQYHRRRFGYSPWSEVEANMQPQESLMISRTRSGTPPLLFGSRAMEQSQPNGRMPVDVESEQDWETVEGLSRQETRRAVLQGTVSSHADYSSSSSEMRSRGLPPGGQMLEHPTHPRYVQSWNMLRDERTGRTILLSEANNEASQARNGNMANSPLIPRRLFSDYYHPSPLSERQAQLFDSSPNSLEPEYGSPDTQDVASTPLHGPAFGFDSSRHGPPLASDQNTDSVSCSGDDSSFLEMASKSEQAGNHENPRLSRKEQSSAWVSTDEDANGDVFVDECARHGSFAQMVSAGPKGNVTGTPQGTGAREVGSSLANASSPNGELLSSPNLGLSPVAAVAEIESAKKSYRRTIDGSLDTIRTASSDALFKSLHKASSSRYSDRSLDEGFTALPTVLSNLPQEVLEHRQHLIDHNLLPGPKIPPVRELKRKSAPLAFFADIKEATTSTGAALGRQIHQIFPFPRAQLRQRSPQRRAAGQDPTDTDFELPDIHSAQSGNMKISQRNKDARKRKVSDSEESNNSPNPKATSRSAHLLSVVSTGPYDGVTTSSEPVDLDGVTVHPTTTANINGRARKQPSTKRVSRATLGTTSNHRVHKSTPKKPAHGAHVARPPLGSAQHLLQLQARVGRIWQPLYVDLPGRGHSASEVLGSLRPVPRSELPAGYNRGDLPEAHADDPHLHRVPRVRSLEKRLKYQKDISRLFLVLCVICPPLWLIYGCGFMDGVMDWCSRGDVTEMGKTEKVVALSLGGILFIAAIAGMIIGIMFAAH